VGDPAVVEEEEEQVREVELHLPLVLPNQLMGVVHLSVNQDLRREEARIDGLRVIVLLEGM
jgi:hypothetical protein